MRWWRRKSTDGGSRSDDALESSLYTLAEAGVETVVFVSGSARGVPCQEAQLLDGGRIPIKLAETTPLAECTEKDGCVCRYDEWAPAGSSKGEFQDQGGE